MKQQITLYGRDAVTVSKAGHRQCEVLVGASHWKSASGLPEAARALRADPTTVRLTAPSRALTEDVLHQTLPSDGDVMPALQAALLDFATDDLEREALTIIQRELLA